MVGLQGRQCLHSMMHGLSVDSEPTGVSGYTAEVEWL